MKLKLKNLYINQHGQGLTEYSLIIFVIVIGIIGALKLVGIEMDDLYYDIQIKVLTALS